MSWKWTIKKEIEELKSSSSSIESLKKWNFEWIDLWFKENFQKVYWSKKKFLIYAWSIKKYLHREGLDYNMNSDKKIFWNLVCYII